MGDVPVSFSFENGNHSEGLHNPSVWVIGHHCEQDLVSVIRLDVCVIWKCEKWSECCTFGVSKSLTFFIRFAR